MTRVTLAVNIVPTDPNDHTGLQLAFQAGAGGAGMEIVLTPIGVPVGASFDGWTIAEGLQRLGGMLGVQAITDIGSLSPPGPWGELFNQVQIVPSLRVQPVGADPSVSLDLQLFKTGAAHASGITIGGPIGYGIEIEPQITVYDLVAGYSKAKGLDLKARVLILPQGNTQSAGKPALMSYPFPVPDQNATSSFKLNFLGIGQRFAPTIDLTQADPLKAAFLALQEAFASDDPADVLNNLVQSYYKPEVGWFFALDLDVRGFTVRAVLADPVLYGLEITCDSGPFTGLLAEILYQKIGADLGVFYGKIVLPDSIRQIELGAISMTIPSFELWIYTNGDFKVAIGWPLGPDSFSLQVAIFMGSAGLYFGKLRSGDNPTGRSAPQINYDPILVFGLALQVGVGRSISKGPISAQASLTVTGVFQGLLAWLSAGASGQGGIAQNPNYYWFSASVTLAGVVQGSVDLGIISATVSISVWANVATAFETNFGTVVNASVGVEVEVSIHVVFFTIHIHFSATLDVSVTLIDGEPASVDGPSNPDLNAFIPHARVQLAAARAWPVHEAFLAAATVTINLSFILQPAVPYDAAGNGQIAAVATLLISCPDPASPAAGTDFEALTDLLMPWLMRNYGGAEQTWQNVAAALGPGGQPAPDGFESGLEALLAGVAFVITGIDLTKNQAAASVAIFPMFDPLVLTAGGDSWNFGAAPLTYSTYPAALAQYFAALSALTPPAPALRAAALATAPDGPSLGHLLFINWFLALARQLAAALSDDPNQTPAGLAKIAGMMSRMALHGTRLPDPAIVHGPSDPVTEAIIHPLYSLDNQQFNASGGANLQASLSLAGGGGGGGGGLSITFAGGASATAILPGGTPPAAPNPGWRGGNGGAAGIAVTPLPPLSAGPLCIAVTARTPGAGPVSLFPGQSGALATQVLTLPAAAVTHVGGGGLTGILRTQPDPTKAVVTPFAPGLLIPLNLRRVPLQPATDLAEKAGLQPTARFATDVYALIGTDDSSRALLEQALDDANFSVRRIVPLTLQSNTLTTDALDLSAQPVLLFKSNLSTTSQPNTLATPMLLLRRLAANAALGPVAAGLADVQDFLRLVWEASVVHSSGFYLRYADSTGNGLPDALFQKDTARFWLWLDLGDAPADGTLLLPYVNSLVIADTGDTAKATQYLGLAQGSQDLVSWRPAMPPGCTGAQLIWNAPPGPDATPYSAASVAALYHMIELQLGGGAYAQTLWSTALSPVSQTKDDSGNITSATYQQVVPAWRFLAAAAGSPYAAVGSAATLNFRLGDVFGNVLSTAQGQYSASFPVIYNDPLLAPSAWPGCQALYDLIPVGGAPSLVITITLDPAGLQAHRASLRARHGAALADQSLAAAQAVWMNIVQQVSDANFGAAVSSTLYGDPDSGDVWPALGDPAAVLSQVQSAAAKLNSAVQGASTDKTSASITLPLDLTKVAARPSDIFPLGVRLTFTRRNTDATAVRNLPEIGAVTALLAPDLPAPAKGADNAAPQLTAWAAQVESLLTGFDGAGGKIKLAQRPMSAADDTTTQAPGLWAVRLSATAGIAVSRQPATAGPAYFTMRPFSTTLQYGQTDITTWDSSLNPTTTRSSAASVDPDALMLNFLGSFDRLMAPDLAAGIARLGASTGAFSALMANKATIAAVLSQRLIPVYTGQPEGDKQDAVTQFEQSLLAQLSNAYATAAVVQVPLSVSVTGSAEPGAALPPRLYGALATGAPASGTAPFTLTSPKLALDGTQKPWLTFLATVKQPEKQSILTLNPVWTVSHIEHDFEPDETRFGYLPSGWLKFVVPDAASPLSVPLGGMDVPVPLRAYPPPPVLVSQAAAAPGSRLGLRATVDDPIADMIRQAMRWPFTLTIGKADQSSQDDLWVTSTFNQPIGWQPPAAANDGPLTPLTAALLRFQAGFASVGPLLNLLEGNDPNAAKLITVLVQLVADVTAALSPARAFLAVPQVEQLIWVLRYKDVQQDEFTVFGRVTPANAGTPLLFPVINGTAGATPAATPAAEAPDGQEGWMQSAYTFSGGVPAQLVLAITGLDLLADQTVIGSAHVTRNADLGATVNPLLVYQTPEISFSNVLVPYVEVTQTLGPATGTSLADMITSVLTPFADAGASLGSDRLLRIAATYNYPVLTPPDGGAPLMASIPAILNAGEALGTDPAPLAQAFAAALQGWGQAVSLPRAGASFSLAISLFINVVSEGASRTVPLLTIDRVDLTVPAGWPN